MSKGVNQVILIGRLGKEPETRATQDGKTITNITLATSESWTDRNTGQKQERTEWHRVVFFGKLAEIAAEYLDKGKLCYIGGSLRTRKWQDNNGQDRYTTEVVAKDMQMLSGKGESGTNPAPAQNAPQSPENGPESDFDFHDDIPF